MRHSNAPKFRYECGQRASGWTKYSNCQHTTISGRKVRLLTDQELADLRHRFNFIRYGETPPSDSPAVDRCRPAPKKLEE